LNPTQTSSLPAESTAPCSVANLTLWHKQQLPGWDERAARAGAGRGGKFQAAAVVRAGARRGEGCGAELRSLPGSVESCPWGSARRYQSDVCTFSVCSQLPPSPRRCREGTGMRAGCRQDRRHSVVLLVIQLQGMIINVHQCKRWRERTRSQEVAV